jgi:hypothetical protein
VSHRWAGVGVTRNARTGKPMGRDALDQMRGARGLGRAGREGDAPDSRPLSAAVAAMGASTPGGAELSQHPSQVAARRTELPAQQDCPPRGNANETTDG